MKIKYLEDMAPKQWVMTNLKKIIHVFLINHKWILKNVFLFSLMRISLVLNVHTYYSMKIKIKCWLNEQLWTDYKHDNFIYRKKKYKLKVKIGKQKQILRIIAQGIEPCKCSNKVKYCKINNVLFFGCIVFQWEKNYYCFWVFCDYKEIKRNYNCF